MESLLASLFQLSGVVSQYILLWTLTYFLFTTIVLHSDGFEHETVTKQWNFNQIRDKYAQKTGETNGFNIIFVITEFL
jgi:hypothetical protein